MSFSKIHKRQATFTAFFINFTWLYNCTLKTCICLLLNLCCGSYCALTYLIDLLSNISDIITDLMGMSVSSFELYHILLLCHPLYFTSVFIGFVTHLMKTVTFLFLKLWFHLFCGWFDFYGFTIHTPASHIGPALRLWYSQSPAAYCPGT